MNKIPSKISLDRLDNMITNFQNGPLKKDSEVLMNNPINMENNINDYNLDNLNNSQISHFKNLNFTYNENDILKLMQESNSKFINNNKLIENLIQRKNEFLLKEKNEIINKINNNNNNSKILRNSNEIEIEKKIEINLKLKEEIKLKCKKLISLIEQKKSLQNKCAQINQESSSNLNEIKFLFPKIKNNENKISLLLSKISDNNNEISYLEKKNKQIQELTEQIKQINNDYIYYNRILNNDFQESKGNIRVFCRVRPPITNKENSNEICKFDFSENSITIYGKIQKSNIGKNEDIQNKDYYKLDRVFPMDSTQETIFNEVSQLVQSALDGFNVCIFAYGQTGSGKTYTMEGEKDEKRGIIPRSIEKIFKFKEELKTLGWEYVIKLKVIEIYCSDIRDLLKSKDNIIKDNNEITVKEIKNINDWENYYVFANGNRAVASTNCNEHSSRSHCVYQIELEGKNTFKGNVNIGTLNLVDLAGSEKVNQSGVSGQRLKETISINKSLSALKGVIGALINGNKNGFIPYKDSILTWLLRDYLGGDSKTLMFVNISPMIANVQESNNSLKFAIDVNNCMLDSI